MNRVVITGLGCITVIGATPETLWHSLESGQTGTVPVASQKFKQAGQILNRRHPSLPGPNSSRTAGRLAGRAFE